jgi:hypothetical protein
VTLSSTGAVHTLQNAILEYGPQRDRIENLLVAVGLFVAGVGFVWPTLAGVDETI